MVQLFGVNHVRTRRAGERNNSISLSACACFNAAVISEVKKSSCITVKICNVQLPLCYFSVTLTVSVSGKIQKKKQELNYYWRQADACGYCFYTIKALEEKKCSHCQRGVTDPLKGVSHWLWYLRRMQFIYASMYCRRRYCNAACSVLERSYSHVRHWHSSDSLCML